VSKRTAKRAWNERLPWRANFLERRVCELRRTPFIGSSVNRWIFMNKVVHAQE
jgi:hypothetical protein